MHRMGGRWSHVGAVCFICSRVRHNGGGWHQLGATCTLWGHMGAVRTMWEPCALQWTHVRADCAIREADGTVWEQHAPYLEATCTTSEQWEAAGVILEADGGSMGRFSYSRTKPHSSAGGIERI
jgi:hypothetical protein